MREAVPPIDAWLAELGVEVVGASGAAGSEAISRDVVLDGERRFDLRVTVAWVSGIGLSLWAYYGLDRPMLVSELPAPAVTRPELARGLVRLTVVADRLLEETASAVVDRAVLPDWSGRAPRNRALLDDYRLEVEGEMPAWQPPLARRARRSPLAWLRGPAR